MQRSKRYILLAGLILSFTLLLAAWSGWRQTALASRLVRLHVVANSDTVEDQTLKLAVRDAVLGECGKLLPKTGSSPQAVEELEKALPTLADIGAAVVTEKGYAYPVSVRLEYADFPQTDYDGFSLPAGSYQALRVEIGAAEGHNWWCVVFPSLCMTSEEEWSETAMAAGLTEEDISLITRSTPDYQIRFRCVELWEELMQKLRQGRAPMTDRAAP